MDHNSRISGFVMKVGSVCSRDTSPYWRMRLICAGVKESWQSLKRLTWLWISPNHEGATLVQPVWPGRWQTSLVIIYFIKTIAIANGLAYRDQVPEQSILPGSKLLCTLLEGLEILIIFNPVQEQTQCRVTFQSRFNLAGASGLKKGPGMSPTRRGNPWHGRSHKNSHEYLIRMRK